MPLRFPRSNRQIPTNPISFAFSVRYFSLAAPMCQSDFRGQIPTSPISSAFSRRYFSLAAPMRHSISQLKSPQILSHLLLVVAIFPLPHPCAIRFPRSTRQISTNPISSAFGRYFSLAAPMSSRFPKAIYQTSTSPISSAL